MVSLAPLDLTSSRDSSSNTNAKKYDTAWMDALVLPTHGAEASTQSWSGPLDAFASPQQIGERIEILLRHCLSVRGARGITERDFGRFLHAKYPDIATAARSNGGLRSLRRQFASDVCVEESPLGSPSGAGSVRDLVLKQPKDYRDAARPAFLESDFAVGEWNTSEMNDGDDAATDASRREALGADVDVDYIDFGEYYRDEDDDGDDVDDDDFAFFLDEGGDEWELMSESGARSYLASMRVIELKEQLRERRVPVSGTKAELVDRLLRYRVAP